MSAVRSEAHRGQRGRVTTTALEDDLRAVREAMRDNDVVALESTTVARLAATAELATALRSRHPGIVAEKGVAARLLIRAALRAMERWEMATPPILHVARGYIEGRPIVDIAADLHVSREYVSRTLAPRAVHSVAVIILRIAASSTLLEDVLD